MEKKHMSVHAVSFVRLPTFSYPRTICNQFETNFNINTRKISFLEKNFSLFIFFFLDQHSITIFIGFFFQHIIHMFIWWHSSWRKYSEWSRIWWWTLMKLNWNFLLFFSMLSLKYYICTNHHFFLENKNQDDPNFTFYILIYWWFNDTR